MLKALISHTHARTTIICNIEPFYRFPYTVCMCLYIHVLPNKLCESHTHTHTHMHAYALNISSWFRTFCSYSACLLVPFTADNGPSNGRKRERRTHICTQNCCWCRCWCCCRRCCWLLILSAVHNAYQFERNDRSICVLCRCYSVHAVDRNEWVYVCACTCVCRCRITNVYSDNVIPYRDTIASICATNWNYQFSTTAQCGFWET